MNHKRKTEKEKAANILAANVKRKKTLAAKRFVAHARVQQRKNIRKKERLNTLIAARKVRHKAYLQEVERIKESDQWASSYNKETGIVEDPEERSPLPAAEDWNAPLEVHTEPEDFEESDGELDDEFL